MEMVAEGNVWGAAGVTGGVTGTAVIVTHSASEKQRRI